MRRKYAARTAAVAQIETGLGNEKANLPGYQKYQHVAAMARRMVRSVMTDARRGWTGSGRTVRGAHTPMVRRLIQTRGDSGRAHGLNTSRRTPRPEHALAAIGQ